MWIGKLDTELWEITGPGVVYNFPRDPHCEMIYCNIEGAARDANAECTNAPRTVRQCIMHACRHAQRCFVLLCVCLCVCVCVCLCSAAVALASCLSRPSSASATAIRTQIDALCCTSAFLSFPQRFRHHMDSASSVWRIEVTYAICVCV